MWFCVMANMCHHQSHENKHLFVFYVCKMNEAQSDFAGQQYN